MRIVLWGAKASAKERVQTIALVIVGKTVQIRATGVALQIAQMVALRLVAGLAKKPVKTFANRRVKALAWKFARTHALPAVRAHV